MSDCVNCDSLWAQDRIRLYLVRSQGASTAARPYDEHSDPDLLTSPPLGTLDTILRHFDQPTASLSSAHSDVHHMRSPFLGSPEPDLTDDSSEPALTDYYSPDTDLADEPPETDLTDDSPDSDLTDNAGLSIKTMASTVFLTDTYIRDNFGDYGFLENTDLPYLPGTKPSTETTVSSQFLADLWEQDLVRDTDDAPMPMLPQFYDHEGRRMEVDGWVVEPRYVDADMMQLSATSTASASPIHPASLTRAHTSTLAPNPEGFFVVTGGRARGILTEWSDVQPLVADYPGFAFGCFGTREAADAAWRSAGEGTVPESIRPYCAAHPPSLPPNRPMQSNYAFYAVAKGCQIGIYTNWNDAYPHIQYHKDAVFKGFRTLQECLDWFNAKLKRHAK
ncbi:hypothetical protein FA95DRAFT_1612503 [Auriscalpium vulgare]|uniref:Uncharacterized protein n=1 Tax=Auriscalpium vulgare TaxID=40419 RepID=A0ACB8R7K0_9AGAM|nr:hypothetical protein FA95DRAFT_1612503 [Auriscalpium vulgare]